MANTPLNYIILYFVKNSTKNHINNLQKLILKIKISGTKKGLILQIVPENY